MVKTIFKRILFFSLCAILSMVLSAQEITGSWHGKLLLPGGISLRLVFNISKTDAGYSATMDSPDQGAKGIPMTSATLTDNLLTIIFDAAKIKYTGQAVGNDSIAGTFEQFGNTSPLGLKLKTEAAAKLNRPQEPTAPFPYKSEDLKFGNNKDNVILSGTLTMPQAGEKFPAVILVSGSGAQNRNEELMGHKPFLVIADYLTRNGFAVLRYDDRGSYESTGDFSKATSFDLANDAEAAFNYLKTRKEINPEKIGIIGHSEGGIIAPIIAARNSEIAFIVMLAGPGLKGSEILLLQQQAISKANGISEIELKNNHDLNHAIFSLIDKNKNPVALRFLLTDYLKESINNSATLKVPEGMSKDEFIEMQLKQILTPWMLEFIRFNPAPTLEKVKCPVLALIGSKDLQVPANENIPALITAFKKGGNEKAIVKELDGLNHLFQNCNTGSPAEYSTIEETFAPDALKLITDWLKKQ